jgi:hypothetical protein
MREAQLTLDEPSLRDVLRKVNPFRVIPAAGGMDPSITRALDLQGGSILYRFHSNQSRLTTNPPAQKVWRVSGTSVALPAAEIKESLTREEY